MPTGYTAGILDGTTNSFTDFAKLCMRAFGATIHMRDEGLEMEYIPRTPDKYYYEQIEKANQLFSDSQNLSDEAIINLRKAELEESKKYHEAAIERIKEGRVKLEAMLQQAKAYQAPTADHVEIKEFMIQQLTETIKRDGDSDYNEGKLLEVNRELENLNVEVIRKNMVDKARRGLKYHRDELGKELARCTLSNTWVEQFVKSLEGTTAVV
jgi:hypothetical protein